MPNERSASSPEASAPPPEHDYDAILSAMMETERGRWFLEEYARRSRNADVKFLLEAVSRLEARMLDSQRDVDADLFDDGEPPPTAEPATAATTDTLRADAEPELPEDYEVKPVLQGSAVETATPAPPAPTPEATSPPVAAAAEPSAPTPAAAEPEPPATARAPAEPSDKGPAPAGLIEIEYAHLSPEDPAKPLVPVEYASEAPWGPGRPPGPSRNLIEQLDLLADVPEPVPEVTLTPASVAPKPAGAAYSASAEQAIAEVEADDPLAPLMAMSRAERIALFS